MASYLTAGGGTSGKGGPPMVRKAKSKLILLNESYVKEQADKKANAAQMLAEERVDLVECKIELNFDQDSMERHIARDRKLMEKLSEEIRPASRRNFELEKNLAIIDKQIQRLIHNMISIAQLDELAGGVFAEKKAIGAASPLEGKKAMYEKLFHILQKEPRYFACLANFVEVRDVSDFVKTVVFDMYGDQYDNREERLLLQLFQMVLQKTFNDAKDIGSFMRSNTAITQMLSAYARRGQGLGILREILEKPIREMVQQNSLNLEINPVEVYRQIINSYEAKMSKPWDGERNPTADAAADNKYVKRLIPPRVKQLEYIAEHFLSRIIETVDQVPFGIRWICRQLAEMAQTRFPEADRYQIGGLVGGYIYLRFFNPVIVTPESVHFVEKKLSKTMRRNLILVAKILQNLSNGVQFRDKFMQTLDAWIDRHREDIQTYFARLIDVDELSDRMDVDNLLERVRKRDQTIQISFNQIFLIHRLLLKHRTEWSHNNPDDPVLQILAQLGIAPDKVKHAENHSINLRLQADDLKEDESGGGGEDHDLKSSGLFEQVSSRDPVVLSIRYRLRSILLDVDIPEVYMLQFRNSLRAYLFHVRDWARNNGNIKVMQDAESVMSGISKYLRTSDAKDATQGFNNFLLLYVNEIRDIKRRADRFHAKVEAVARARDTIIDHANYLGTKLQYYQKYLDNVMGSDGQDIPGKGKGKGKKKKEKKKRKGKGKAKGKAVKFTHKRLQELNVIMEVDEDVIRRTRANFNNLVYYFSRVGPDDFEVEVKYRVGFGAKISPFPEPFQLSLNKLLEMKDSHQTRYQLEMVTLAVTELIKLINSEFL